MAEIGTSEKKRNENDKNTNFMMKNNNSNNNNKNAMKVYESIKNNIFFWTRPTDPRCNILQTLGRQWNAEVV